MSINQLIYKVIIIYRGKVLDLFCEWVLIKNLSLRISWFLVSKPSIDWKKFTGKIETIYNFTYRENILLQRTAFLK